MLTNEMYIKLKVITNVCTHHPNWSFILYIYKRRLWKQALVFLAQEQVIHCPRTGSDEGGGGEVASPPLWTRKQNYESCARIAAHVRDGEPVLIVEDTGSYLACNVEAMAVWVKKPKTTEKLKSRRRLTWGSVGDLSCAPSKWVSNGSALYCAWYFARHCAAPEVAHVWFAILTSIENNNNNSNNKNNDNKKELKRQ